MRVVVGTRHLSPLLVLARNLIVAGLLTVGLLSALTLNAAASVLGEPEFSPEVRKQTTRTLKVNGFGSESPSTSGQALQGASDLQENAEGNLQTPTNQSLQNAGGRNTFND